MQKFSFKVVRRKRIMAKESSEFQISVKKLRKVDILKLW